MAAVAVSVPFNGSERWRWRGTSNKRQQQFDGSDGLTREWQQSTARRRLSGGHCAAANNAAQQACDGSSRRQ
ncbi:hypothetical protein PR002_g18865 [Phytophthora rubi]|uniref:Uncharacterized protein n=1 Tax=Phytophthora rubi TaxID=129364 RepID=A0A6A3JXM2_9STRA|nr:hypothetical protein PR002_g18865 [Phytophthora rubi]